MLHIIPSAYCVSFGNITLWTLNAVQMLFYVKKVVLHIFLIDFHFHMEICPITKKIGCKPDHVDFCNNSV